MTKYSLLNPEGRKIRECEDLRAAKLHAVRISRRCQVDIVTDTNAGQKLVARFVQGKNILHRPRLRRKPAISALVQRDYASPGDPIRTSIGQPG